MLRLVPAASEAPPRPSLTLADTSDMLGFLAESALHHATSGRLEEAGGMFHWLVEMSADKRSKRRGHFLTRLARIEIQLGQVDEAQKRLEEAYRLDTTNVETLIALGSLHEANKKWAEALKIYRSMLLQNADKSGHIRRGDIYLCLARTHMGLSEKPKAQAMLRRGVEEDPTHDELKKMLEELGG